MLVLLRCVTSPENQSLFVSIKTTNNDDEKITIVRPELEMLFNSARVRLFLQISLKICTSTFTIVIYQLQYVRVC